MTLFFEKWDSWCKPLYEYDGIPFHSKFIMVEYVTNKKKQMRQITKGKGYIIMRYKSCNEVTS